MARPIHKAVAQPNRVRVLFSAPASHRYKKYICCSALLRCDCCAMAQVDTVWQSTYVTAYENKLEYNYPLFFCCCLVDWVGVIYYDRDILRQVGKASCCKPACTHCSPCPTCFDICGEGLVLYGATLFSRNLTCLPPCGSGCFCCRVFGMLHGLEDCEQLENAINDGRQTAMARINAPGWEAP